MFVEIYPDGFLYKHKTMKGVSAESEINSDTFKFNIMGPSKDCTVK